MTVRVQLYFDRIGFSGPSRPDLKALRELLLKHPQAIPFENIDPFCGRPVPLVPATVWAKLVHNRRGGYCFEQNLLLRQVLETMGFAVKGLLARVLWNVPDGAALPRTHMVLVVTIDGAEYLADVGFGGLTLTAPLRLDDEAAQETPHGDFRIISGGDGRIVQAEVNGAWMPLYTFDRQEQRPVDYEMANWYVANHPQSRFVVDLIAARVDGDRRHALRNRSYSVYSLGGAAEKHEIADVAALKRTLAEVFHIHADDDAALARLFVDVK